MLDTRESPHFVEYVTLLKQLRELIYEGKGERTKPIICGTEWVNRGFT